MGTTLLARDPDGGLSTTEAYCDTAFNIAWMADANFAQSGGTDADGKMNRAAAGLPVTGSRGYRGRGTDVTGDSRVDFHKLRGIRFLYPSSRQHGTCKTIDNDSTVLIC